jgi:photosystem II S4 domain protein
MLPRRDLLSGSRHPAELEVLIASAERVLHTWQPLWSGFLEGSVLEEAQQRLGDLAELQLHAEGGYSGAERRRLLLSRRDGAQECDPVEAGLGGLSLNGNFLFDPAEPADFRASLTTAGLPPQALGDLWLRGDRGAQAVIATSWALPEAVDLRVRSVPVSLEPLPLEQLQPPGRRLPRRIDTVEASRRLDAVASAGFGVSRSRMGSWIRAGQVRLNWAAVTRPGHELVEGDRVQLSGKGELQVEAISPTKRDRFRITLQRR